jgi:hypothetical protein
MKGDITDGPSYWLPGVSNDNAADEDGKAEAPGIGHNGGPGLDQTSGQQPQDSSAAAVAAALIANGHAFDKHVLDGNEFDSSITTPQQFSSLIQGIIVNPSAVKQLSNGRSAYWDDASGVVVIQDPKSVDGGTAFKPLSGRKYFDNLVR